MTKLSDIQLVLLATAAQRTDGSILPPPDSIGSQALRLARSIQALIKHGLASEAPVTEPALSWRQDGEQRYGAFITDAGRRRQHSRDHLA